MNYAKKPGLTGSHLKWIAIITMFIDHIGAALLEIGLLPKIANAVLAGNSFDYVMSDYHFWYRFDDILRSIGRLAFPLFCFLLVEGFLHTKNVKKYALRLGLFALISEIPFDLAFNGKALELSYQNVFFTLLIGLLMLIGLKYFEETLPPHISWLRFIVALTGILLAVFLRTDYDAFGIMLIFLLYEFRSLKTLRCIAGAILMLFNSTTGFLAFLFVWFYNGERGKQLPKYFFYAFYPVHLLLLFLVRLIFL
jgi:hypothetical protein